MLSNFIPPSRNFIRNRTKEIQGDIDQIKSGIDDFESRKEKRLEEDERYIKENKEKIDFLEKWITKRTPRAVPNVVEVQLVDHCNLNCKHCAHFSSIATPYFADVDAFFRDMSRLSYLYDGTIREIHLMGGEPLLHPRAIDFAVISRQFFPSAQIVFVTNGILLPDMQEDFWVGCKENKIVLRPTKYPIKVDYELCEKIAKRYDLDYKYYGSGKSEKEFWKDVLDLTGTQDTEKSFTICNRANALALLREGKIFPCPIAANAHYLNQRFGEVVKICDRDSIDIYSVEKAQEINEFLAHSIPFCRYCNMKARIYGIPWEVSKNELSEWT